MLNSVLKFLTGELNTYLHTQIDLPSFEVKLSPIVDGTGNYAFDGESIAVNLINIEEERVFKSQLPEYQYKEEQHVVLVPALKLNLYLLFAARFQNYEQALKFISLILWYFQSHPVFTPQEYPALDQRIERLTLELQSLNYEQLNQVWAFIGGKQLPSVIYKLRMVVLQHEIPTAVQPPVMEINTDLHRS